MSIHLFTVITASEVVNIVFIGFMASWLRVGVGLLPGTVVFECPVLELENQTRTVKD